MDFQWKNCDNFLFLFAVFGLLSVANISRQTEMSSSRERNASEENQLRLAVCMNGNGTNYSEQKQTNRTKTGSHSDLCKAISLLPAIAIGGAA